MAPCLGFCASRVSLTGDALSLGTSFSLSHAAVGLLDGKGVLRALKRSVDPGDLLAGTVILMRALIFIAENTWP